MKLTREKYQNLEQYLVDFRARLNQTSTREEAVPIFKEAVVELNKYGLLPKRMSVKQAQKLTTGVYQNRNIVMHQKKLLHNHLFAQENYSNFLCLIAGRTNHTSFENIGTILINSIRDGEFGFVSYLLTDTCMGNPLAVMNRINIGYYVMGHDIHSASGWVTTFDLFGNKTIEENIRGALPVLATYYYAYPTGKIRICPAAVGFIGIKISPNFHPDSYSDVVFGVDFFYIGSALWVKITSEQP